MGDGAGVGLRHRMRRNLELWIISPVSVLGPLTTKPAAGVSQTVTQFRGICKERAMVCHSPDAYLLMWKFYQVVLSLTTWTRRRKLVRHSRADRRSSNGGYIYIWLTVLKKTAGRQPKIKPSDHNPTPKDLFPTCQGEGKKWNWPRTLQNIPPRSPPTGRQSRRKIDN